MAIYQFLDLRLAWLKFYGSSQTSNMDWWKALLKCSNLLLWKFGQRPTKRDHWQEGCDHNRFDWKEKNKTKKGVLNKFIFTKILCIFCHAT